MNDPLKPADRAFLANEVDRLSAALNQAYDDAELWRRLKDAEKRAPLIGLELARAQERLCAASADEIIAKREAEFAHIRGISVTVVGPPPPGSLSALSARYIINYERVIYDPTFRRSDWAPVSINGFNALASEVLRYLVLCKPSAIPAIIMEMAPDNPEAAMKAYFIALQRGYMTGPATVQ